jgi:CubicO group peptidase (beta-lactamase class C family)
MRRRGRRAVLALHALGIVLLVLDGCATRKSAPQVESPVSEAPAIVEADAIDRLFVQYDRPRVPGAAVVVIHNGRVAFIRGYGLADLETSTRVTKRTNFRLASLTKAFTAMAILLLVGEDRLHLDDRARDILPGFPAYGREIRIRHLLTHTSGLMNYQQFVPDSRTRQIKDRDVLALLQGARGTYFPPGSAFRYGDSGYAILALVVEAASGTSFTRFLHDRIFTRLGMDSTVAYEAGGSSVPNRAVGYSLTRDGFRPSDQSITSAVLGDGGVYSSVHDLVAWDRALDNHTLIDGPLQALAWTPATMNGGTKAPYGFGWFIERDVNGTRLSHRGDTSGFTHFIVKYPDRRLTVVVLTNRKGGAPGDIAATITALPSFRTTP